MAVNVEWGVAAETPPDAKKHRVALLMFAVLLVSYMTNAMDRQIFPLLLSDVRNEYGYSIAAAGLLSTIFTLGLAVAGMPTAWLLTKLSRKAVLQLGIFIYSAGTAATVLSYAFSDMLFYRAITGVGEAMQVTVLLAIAASYFGRYRSASVGTLSFTYGIGAIIGPVLAGFLLAHYHSWRMPMVVFGLLGIVTMVVIAYAVKPWFSETIGNAANQADAGGADKLFNWNIVGLSIISILWGLALYAYFGLYPTYLREVLHYSPPQAGSLISFFGLGALTSIGGGWLGDRYSPRVVLGGGFFICAVLAFLLFHGISDYTVLAGLSLVWGAIAGGVLFVNVAAYHVKAVRPRLASAGAGLFVTMFYGAGATSGYALGYLIHGYGWETAANVQIVGACIVSGIVSLLLRPAEMSLRTQGSTESKAGISPAVH